MSFLAVINVFQGTLAHINQLYAVCDRLGRGIRPELPNYLSATRRDTELKLETSKIRSSSRGHNSKRVIVKTHTKKVSSGIYWTTEDLI